MKLHTLLAVACFLLLNSAATAQQQNPAPKNTAPETRKSQPGAEQKTPELQNPDLYRLIVVIGAPDASVKIVQQLLALKKQFAPRTLALTNWRKQTFQSTWEAKIRSRITLEKLAERWAPVLARHFTPEEIKAVLEFYDTPAGRKLLSEQSAVLRESYDATEEWRRETIAEVMKEMEAEFPGAKETEQALQVTSQKP